MSVNKSSIKIHARFENVTNEKCSNIQNESFEKANNENSFNIKKNEPI